MPISKGNGDTSSLVGDLDVNYINGCVGSNIPVKVIAVVSV